jgi:hypothetical protein
MLKIGMSGLAPISSAIPLKADVAAVGRESPLLTLSRHFTWRVVKFLEQASISIER